MAEYAHAYGGPPAPSMPWPMFLALLRRVGRFEARARLRLVDSVTTAIGAAFEGGGEISIFRDELFGMAYPLAEGSQAVRLIPNLAQVTQP